MPQVRPFNGIRYSSPSELAELVCPPYDIISEADQAQLHDKHPHNAVRLELAQRSGEGPDRYSGARETFEAWMRQGVLRPDPSPSLYVYRQDFVFRGERRRVAGVIGALQLEDFGPGSGVLPHERTMAGPKADRLALMRALPLNVSPIFAIYRGGGALAPFFDSLAHRPSAARLQDADGVLHRLWVVDAPAEVEALASALRPGPLVIADGHHRYETAIAFHREHAGRGASGEHGAIMCFCVDADVEELVVLAYHRALKTSVGPAALRARLSDRFPTEPIDPDRLEEACEWSRADHPLVWVLPDSRLLVEVSDADVVAAVGERARAWRDLDVVALHEAVLPEVLPDGADELVFSKDPNEIVRLVEEHGWTAGVLLRALKATQVVDVARSGERMPQKASYFWPKAVTGLVFRPLS